LENIFTFLTAIANRVAGALARLLIEKVAKPAANPDARSGAPPARGHRVMITTQIVIGDAAE
jgi:hypothetical protein